MVRPYAFRNPIRDRATILASAITILVRHTAPDAIESAEFQQHLAGMIRDELADHVREIVNDVFADRDVGGTS